MSLNNGWTGSCVAAASATTRLLAFESEDELPRAYTVSVKAVRAADPATQPRSLISQNLLVTIAVGGITKIFECDLTAGGDCFDIIAESITIDVVNGSALAVDVLTCDGSVTRHVEGVQWRVPRRSQVTTWVNAVPQNVVIPRYAKNMWIHKTTSTNLALSILSGGGTTIFIYTLGNLSVVAPHFIPLPNGGDSLQATPGANMSSLQVYEIGV